MKKLIEDWSIEIHHRETIEELGSFIEERVFDGFVTANFLWLRFYNGNVQNAEKFVSQKNLEITNLALDYLQFQYPGKKP